jgi:hypothetical protein
MRIGSVLRIGKFSAQAPQFSRQAGSRRLQLFQMPKSLGANEHQQKKQEVIAGVDQCAGGQ